MALLTTGRSVRTSGLPENEITRLLLNRIILEERVKQQEFRWAAPFRPSAVLWSGLIK